MPSFAGIEFCELPGSPAIRFGQNGCFVDRTLQMDYESAVPFLEALFNKAPLSGDRQFFGVPKLTSINNQGVNTVDTFPVCVDAEIVPTGGGRQSGLTSVGTGITARATYDKADVILKYVPLVTNDYMVQMGVNLAAKDNEGFTFDSSADSEKPGNFRKGPVSVPEPVIDVRIWYYDLHEQAKGPSNKRYSGQSIADNIGAINTGPIEFGRQTAESGNSYDPGVSGQITFAARTLMFSGGDIGLVPFYDRLATRYDLRFKYRKEEWNKEYNANSKAWDTVSPQKHDEVDFGTFIPSITGKPLV